MSKGCKTTTPICYKGIKLVFHEVSLQSTAKTPDLTFLIAGSRIESYILDCLVLEYNNLTVVRKTHLHRRTGALSAEAKRPCQQTQDKREAVAKRSLMALRRQ